MAQLTEIVVDSDHPAALARFWAAVLDGYAVMPYDAAEIARLASLGLTPETDPVVMVTGPGPRLCFHLMPGPRLERTRLHVDLTSANPDAERARLLALGASLVREAACYVVMADPEGNRFCLLNQAAQAASNRTDLRMN